jgi:hypothetical protein
MRTAVAELVMAAAVTILVAPVAAAPPEDVAAYCRVTYPQVLQQVRCLNAEHGAASRVSQAAITADRGAFDRCLGVSPSWSAMESCLAQAARGGPPPTPLAALPPSAARSGDAPDQAAGAPAESGGVAPGAQTPAAPGAIPPVLPGVVPPAAASTPAPSTAALVPPLPTPLAAPTPLAPAALAEPEPPPRPISEADAERHLRSVLERAGTPTARCTKKQYGPGWASICE